MENSNYDQCQFCQKQKEMGNITVVLCKPGYQFEVPIFICEACAKVASQFPEGFREEFYCQTYIYLMNQQMKQQEGHNHEA